MEYFVTGSDGKEYGPIDTDKLRLWLGENRISMSTMVRDFHTGRSLPLSQVPGFAPPAPAPYAHNPYPQAQTKPQRGKDEGMGMFWGAVIRSALAVVMFFALHGLGLIFAGYALFYAIQCQASGNRYGWLAIGVASVAILAVGIGWLVRIQTGAV